jgi:hypothetical protein
MAASLPRLPLAPARRRWADDDRGHPVLRGSRRGPARARPLLLDEARLLGANGEALDAAGIAAGLRDRGHGQTITYSRKVFIR